MTNSKTETGGNQRAPVTDNWLASLLKGVRSATRCESVTAESAGPNLKISCLSPTRMLVFSVDRENPTNKDGELEVKVEEVTGYACKVGSKLTVEQLRALPHSEQKRS
jgi:hypothetical protein